MTEASDIRKILLDSEICDFDFDPCGYSMNAVEGAAISTIHVTPEDGFSYKSFEAVGYDFKVVDLSLLLERVLTCFQPAKFSVALHSSFSGKDLDLDFALNLNGYVCGERSFEVVGLGVSVNYSSLPVLKTAVLQGQFCNSSRTRTRTRKSRRNNYEHSDLSSFTGFFSTK